MRGRRIEHRTRVTSCLLAALLILGFPGPGLVLGATPAAPNPAGSLSVDSDPAGAAVLLDGQAQGTTPLALQALPAGDHRVRVVKEGYLDNSRVVKVVAGQTETLRVRLTHNEVATTTTQVENQPAQQKGGSGKKWALLGLGAAAVGGTAFYFLTKNGPPVAGTIGVSPGGTGMAGTTTYTFTSQGSSDPDNDTLTYEWNFGDGGTGSGQSTTHVYSSAGRYSVTLAVKDKKHSVSALGASVTVERSLAGSWSGPTEPGFGAQVAVNLTQSGSNLGGSMTFSGSLGGTISNVTGTVSATSYPCNVSFTSPSFVIGGYPGSFTVRFSGTTDASGSSMAGTITTTSSALQPPSLSTSATFRR